MLNHFKIVRDTYTDTTVTGKLYLNGEWLCYTLEDAVRNPGVKIYGRTAVPAGTYPLTFEKSPRLSAKAGHDFLTPRMHDIPGFLGCLWHVGNYATDVEGCVALGLTRVKDFVGSSKAACDKVYPLVRAACAGQKFGTVTVSIVNT